MTSLECYENKWFYMKYIGKMVETESLLSTCCSYDPDSVFPEWFKQQGSFLSRYISVSYNMFLFQPFNIHVSLMIY
jgi:hypothetical protein